MNIKQRNSYSQNHIFYGFLNKKGNLKSFLLPPPKIATLPFLKNVLAGRKKLLKIDSNTIFPHIPKIPELKTYNVWQQIKNLPDVQLYFPQFFFET